MNYKMSVWMVFVSLIFIGAACAVIIPGVQETRLFTYPFGEIEAIDISNDLARIAWVIYQDNKAVVIVNGKETAKYDWVDSRSFRFAPDDRTLVYIAGNGGAWEEKRTLLQEPFRRDAAGKMLVYRGGERFAVIGGMRGRSYQGVDALTIAPNARAVAYIVNKGQESVVVSNGEEGPGYFRIAESSLTLSPDGTRLAYAVRKDKNQIRWVMVINGQEGPEYDWLGTQESKVTDIAHGPEPPIFSPSGKRVAYGARRGEKWVVVADGTEGVPCDALKSGSLKFSPGSEELVYAAKKGNAWVLIRNGQEGPTCDDIAAPVFSPDGKRFAYLIMQNSQWHAVIDGQTDSGYDSIDPLSLTFSPGGKHAAYVAKKGSRELLVLDGRPGKEYNEIERPVFSPNGERVAYQALRDRDWIIVCNGQESQSLGGMPAPPIFSPDSRHLAYQVIGSAQKVILDGKSGPDYRMVMGLRFNADGSVGYLAVKDTVLYRVSQGPDQLHSPPG